jgi:hypothetical protein
MTDKLPRCKLCGAAAAMYCDVVSCSNRNCTMYAAWFTEDEWRRLHGPQPELTGVRLGDVLVRAGVIDAAAVEDPDGYDGGQTVAALAMAARELAMPLHSATNTAELATAMQSAPPSRRRGEV